MSTQKRSSFENLNYTDQNLAVSRPRQDSSRESKSPELTELLAKVDAALQAGRPKHGIDLIARSQNRSPWAMNALGVCNLRLGKYTEAIDIFRSLVLNTATLALREDAPTLFKINFATALLADHKVNGCIDVLSEINNDAHPSAQQLWAAINDWKCRFNVWERIDQFLGGEPTRPLNLDWPLGELE